MTGDARGPSQSRFDAIIETADRLWRRGEHFVAGNLVWNRVHRAVSYLRSALWVVPFLSILLVFAIGPALLMLDRWLAWRIAGLELTGARSLYETVITITLSFLVFTFSSLLVAIQVASGQLTPRIIATLLLRDNVVRYSVGLFVFTLIFSVMALDRLEGTVHDIVTLVSGGLGLASMAAFLFLIDYAARLLRPISVLSRVGDMGVAVIVSVYPNRVGDEPDVAVPWQPPADVPRRIVRFAGASEIVVAVDLPTLVREARRRRGIIECVPQVGDFVADGEPLFVLYGTATAIDDAHVQVAVAYGRERTMEQDPMFALRILVDIGLKALSAAINDPTTAVLALDQIHRLLREVGLRQLRDEAIRDRRGQVRVILRTPNWEDFVHVACTEIASYGAGNVQVARRLRALFDNLIATLPPHRHAPLEQEARRLQCMLERLYPIPEDLALASVPDLQGLGGSSGSRKPI